MDSSENRTGDPPLPPVGETRAPAAAAAEGAHSQTNSASGTFFGLRKNQLYFGGVGVTPRDYKARYPPDPPGQEMSDNARIWPIYLEEAADFDANMLAEWRDTIDVLLVFAGLFSAVLTTFVAQTSQNMQPDYNQASTLLLFEILKAMASNGSQPSIPSSPTAFFSTSRSDEWMNSLWFVSLTLSLITALVAVLVKQWLHQYIAIVSDSSAHDRARIRHMRYAGLQTWQVPMIIGLLPVLLHVSLALFFVGLAIFLFSLGMKVAWLVSIIGAATYMAYVIALILPLVHPYCPYKVPLTLYVHRLCRCIHRLYQRGHRLYQHALYQYGNSYLIRRIQYRIIFMRLYPYTHIFGRYRRRYLIKHWDRLQEWNRRKQQERQERQESLISSPKKFPILKEIERDYILKYATTTDAQSLKWLHSSTSNASVHQSILQAISGMTPGTVECLPDKYVSASVISLGQQIEHIKALVPSHVAEGELVELELYCRALSVLSGHPMDEHCNEQLKVLLSSMTTTEKASAAFLEILRDPQRSSLTLQPAVWKILVDITITSPPLSCSTGENVTTIDELTVETREYIYDKLLACWGYDRTQTSDTRTIHLDIMLSLIPRIHQRLLDSLHASDRKEVIETALAIIDGIVLVIRPSLVGIDKILDSFTLLFSLLSSGSEASDVNVDIEIFACVISMIFNMDQSQWIQTISARVRLPNMYSLPMRTEINTLVDIMLLLIKRHRERILYAWVEGHSIVPWQKYILRLTQWASGEQFRQWAFLKRVLAIVVIRELQGRLRYTNLNESLPQYDYGVHMEVDQLPWLLDIYSPGSSSEGVPNPLEYSRIAEHPKFQEFLNSGQPSQEGVVVNDIR
ncbi:uncharacterized protein ARMOST_15957 [Armillaria ostoyae]|uniref:DUF6535 domain-containing protein n=1 Tax=Armillaria ostoyae TaxID=47428 RepID=A0A284RUW8_ARMOS|nr:uncharacterized protein ARMOST_15957 [Armillaria ostoyae]